MSRILVVDDEPELVELVTYIIEGEFDAEVVPAYSGKEAVEILEREKEQISLIFSDYMMPNGDADVIVSHLQKNKLKMPFVIMSGHLTDEHEVFSSGVLTGFISKPFEDKDVTSTIRQVLRSSARPSPHLEEGYVRIRIQLLLRQAPLQQDIYIRLAENKYVKVVQKDDLFDFEDAKKYLSKDINFLYISREDSSAYLQSARQLGEVLSQARRVSFDKASQFAESAIEMTSDFSQVLGWSPEIEKLVESSIEITLKSMSQNEKLTSLLDRILLDPKSYLSSHSVAIAYVAIGVATELGWTSEATRMKLSSAAFLHDICLTDQHLAGIQSLEEMVIHPDMQDIKDIKDYMLHPVLAAELISGWEAKPPLVEEIILQHHEKPDGSGFPSGMKAGAMLPLARLFVFCEDFVDLIFRLGKRDGLNQFLTRVVPDRYEGSEFKKVLRAFSSSLSRNRR